MRAYFEIVAHSWPRCNAAALRALNYRRHQFERYQTVIQTTTFAVAGMTCRMCERHVTRALEGMTGVMDQAKTAVAESCAALRQAFGR